MMVRFEAAAAIERAVFGGGADAGGDATVFFGWYYMVGLSSCQVLLLLRCSWFIIKPVFSRGVSDTIQGLLANTIPRTRKISQPAPLSSACRSTKGILLVATTKRRRIITRRHYSLRRHAMVRGHLL
mmetsp:Transcript_21514/g.43204  ORF Transcript_21514/g.43204 Transcript_21514/m.43204 type:complete len:127 (+) Transcript_21514:1617-1997(+)